MKVSILNLLKSAKDEGGGGPKNCEKKSAILDEMHLWMTLKYSTTYLKHNNKIYSAAMQCFFGKIR